MGFLSSLFKKGEDPDRYCSDPVLGPLSWSEEDEAWLGEFNGLKFSLPYSRLRQPSETAVAYAREVLSDPEWLYSTLAEEKRRRIEKYGPKIAELHGAEVRSLSFGRIHFFIRKGRRILADLEGGKDFRCWRIEYADKQCHGIGFDT
jgi:hypothetical protein